MKRVVITGAGIVSSIGTNKEQVLDSLRACRSGISYAEEYAERGFRSCVKGDVDIDTKEHIDRKLLRFMGDAAAYSYIAMQEAIVHAELTPELVSNERTGLIVGSGGASTKNTVDAADILRNKGAKRVGPYMVPRTMGSTTSACLGTAFKIKGVSYSMSSACSTSAHCIGSAMELIQLGKQDRIFAGGGEELHWTMSCLFDGMAAMSSNFNDKPETASRAFDVDRDGFVIAGGGGIVVMESLDTALARGAPIYAEIVGYGATCDGYDMVQPSGEGAMRCMRLAMATVNAPIDYINAHGTSTPLGDIKELEAIAEIFKEEIPVINSTKSLTGHALGAAGVNEAIYSMLMLNNDFICESANITTIDPVAKDMPIARRRIDNPGLVTAMSNSFGFGGTNACLVLQKYEA
ncbi:MAG: beta-ketoacyl-ACP synthase I [Thiohalomonadales bacterium]